MVKEGVEVTLSQPRTYLKIQINNEEITKKKQLNKSKRKASKPCTYRRMSPNTTCPHLHNRKQEVGDRLTLRYPADGKDPPKKDTKRTKKKKKDIHRANINHSLRSVSSGDRGDYTTETHRYSITEVYTINPGCQNRAT